MGDEEWKCPDHGPMCNPAICKEYALRAYRRWQTGQELRERYHTRRPNDHKSYPGASDGYTTVCTSVENNSFCYADAHKLVDGSSSMNDDGSLKQRFDSLIESHEPEGSQLQPTWDTNNQVSTHTTVSSTCNEQSPSPAQRQPPREPPTFMDVRTNTPYTGRQRPIGTDPVAFTSSQSSATGLRQPAKGVLRSPSLSSPSPRPAR